MIYFIPFLFVFSSLINLVNADPAIALCAFIASTNINATYNEWNCDNTFYRCSWRGVSCAEELNPIGIDLSSVGLKGNQYKLLLLILILFKKYN